MGFNVSDLQITTATTSGVLQALGGFKFPSFTTATRPSSPSEGQTIYNTDISALEVYDGSAWKKFHLVVHLLHGQVRAIDLQTQMIMVWLDITQLTTKLKFMMELIGKQIRKSFLSIDC